GWGGVPSSLFVFELGQGHADTQVVSWRVVERTVALFVPAVTANAVEQIALLGRTKDQGIAAEKILRDSGQVFGHQGSQLLWIAPVLALVGAQGESDVKVPPCLLGKNVGILYQTLSRVHQGDQAYVETPAESRAGFFQGEAGFGRCF